MEFKILRKRMLLEIVHPIMSDKNYGVTFNTQKVNKFKKSEDPKILEGVISAQIEFLLEALKRMKKLGMIPGSKKVSFYLDLGEYHRWLFDTYMIIELNEPIIKEEYGKEFKYTHALVLLYHPSIVKGKYKSIEELREVIKNNPNELFKTESLEMAFGLVSPSDIKGKKITNFMHEGYISPEELFGNRSKAEKILNNAMMKTKFKI